MADDAEYSPRFEGTIQRHGPTGIVELQFEASLTKFQNLVRSDYLPERLD